MRKTMVFVVAMSVVLIGPTVFAQDKPADKPAEQPKDQTSVSQPPAGRKFNDLTPEEQAKLKEKWQNMSADDKAKLQQKTRETLASQNAQAPARRDLASAELARVQDQYKTGIAELQAIKQLALKENAKETAEALTKLIAKREQQYNQQIQTLQRRIKMLQAAQDAKAAQEAKAAQDAKAAQGNKAGSQNQTQVDKQAKPDQTAAPKKDDAKPQSTGTKP